MRTLPGNETWEGMKSHFLISLPYEGTDRDRQSTGLASFKALPLRGQHPGFYRNFLCLSGCREISNNTKTETPFYPIPRPPVNPGQQNFASNRLRGDKRETAKIWGENLLMAKYLVK